MSTKPILLELLLELLEESINKCYECDEYLINHSMERACVARIYYYMQYALVTDPRFQEFSKFNLDNEYNKKMGGTKTTPSHPKGGTRPDIILHKRGDMRKNILVIEFKTQNLSGGRDNDFTKLKY